MADLKYHWAIPASDPSKHRNVQACGRKYTTALAETAVLFVAKVKANSDWYCKDCAKAARLALAAESAPKPDDATWPKPRPISEAPTDGSMVLIRLPDCNPQWTIGVFDPRRRWVDLCLATAIVDPTHFLPLPPSPEVK